MPKRKLKHSLLPHQRVHHEITSPTSFSSWQKQGSTKLYHSFENALRAIDPGDNPEKCAFFTLLLERYVLGHEFAHNVATHFFAEIAPRVPYTHLRKPSGLSNFLYLRKLVLTFPYDPLERHLYIPLIKLFSLKYPRLEADAINKMTVGEKQTYHRL